MDVNTQPRESKTTRIDELEVVDIFDTIQGEGPYVGTPAVFVRLAGCNLQCPLCDTDYTTRRIARDPMNVADQVAGMGRQLVVFTGGEPMRQASLCMVCRSLIQRGMKVQIETNGTFFLDDLPKGVLVVCSPKTEHIHPKLLQRINALKYVVQDLAVSQGDGLPMVVLGERCNVARPPAGFPVSQIYIQPADVGDAEVNRRNMDQAVRTCKQFGYRLCLQVHKIAGLP